MKKDTHNPHSQNRERRIKFPHVDRFHTVICDLHQHTVFSDRDVWPNVRVQEAIKDGLHAISITEHLEFQIHAKDVPHPDRNRSYQLAKEADTNNQLLIINGAEISRDMPPGHCNAVFIADSNKLLVSNPLDAFEEARSQHAFVFWNHPHWENHLPDGMARLTDMHKELISKNLIHGIEVVNEFYYSDEALQIALDNNLTILGTSDIHGLIDWEYDIPNGGHRPVTLAFTDEISENGLKKALMDGRTVAWHRNLLIGKEDNLLPLIKASLSVEKAEYIHNTIIVSVDITNNCDAEYILKNKSEYTFHTIGDLVHLKPQGVTNIEVKTLEKKERFMLNFEVLNAIKAPNQHPEIKISVSVK